MPRRNRNPTTKIPLGASHALANCRTKKTFRSEDAAARAVELAELTSPGVKLSYYRCDMCRGWHLTSKTSR